MAAAVNGPLKDQGDQLEAISVAKSDARTGLVAAHLKRMVRGASSMDGDQDAVSSQRNDLRHQGHHQGKLSGSN